MPFSLLFAAQARRVEAVSLSDGWNFGTASAASQRYLETSFQPIGSPGARESDAVLNSVDEFLALPAGDQQRRMDSFHAVTTAAERWAGSVMGPKPKGKTDAILFEHVRDIQRRIIQNPFTPSFNEFFDGSKYAIGSAAAITTHGAVLRNQQGRKQWVLLAPHEPGAGSVAVTYNSKLKTYPKNMESNRAHEWVHIADKALLGYIDEDGLRLYKHDDYFKLFTEAKAFAITYHLQALWGYPEKAAFFDYLLGKFTKAGSLYPWAQKLFGNGNARRAPDLSSADSGGRSPASGPSEISYASPFLQYIQTVDPQSGNLKTR